MIEVFMGQICLFGFNFTPKGFMPCNGQLLPISQYSALFSLLGTMYGGNGQTTFGLPDLRGRAALNYGQGAGLSNMVQGEMSGTENVTLTTSQMPAHNHVVSVPVSDIPGVADTGDGNILAAQSTPAFTAVSTKSGNYGGVTCGIAGGSLPVAIMQPYLVLNYCIAVEGIYPSRQ